MKPQSHSLPDLAGEHYYSSLSRLHKILEPATYFEIGTASGHSLSLSTCPSVSVDPAYRIFPENLAGIFAKDIVHFYQMTSDDFFHKENPKDIFGKKIELGFLDGMHHCEFLLRDFINTEKHCKPESVLVLHDCLPVEAAIADRDYKSRPTIEPHRADWWAGDVWRTSLLLKRRRPDLQFRVFDANPTGIVLISGLNPNNDDWARNYDDHNLEMFSMNLDEIGIDEFFREMGVEPTSVLAEATSRSDLFE